jgi:hypothetical protein
LRLLLRRVASHLLLLDRVHGHLLSLLLIPSSCSSLLLARLAIASSAIPFGLLFRRASEHEAVTAERLRESKLYAPSLEAYAAQIYAP